MIFNQTNGSSGGGAEFVTVNLPYSTTYYTNTNLQVVSGGALYDVSVLKDSVIYCTGTAEPGMPTSGVTRIAVPATRTYIYQATG